MNFLCQLGEQIFGLHKTKPNCLLRTEDTLLQVIVTKPLLRQTFFSCVGKGIRCGAILTSCARVMYSKILLKIYELRSSYVDVPVGLQQLM
jgi:hypothetical protein